MNSSIYNGYFITKIKIRFSCQLKYYIELCETTKAILDSFITTNNNKIQVFIYIGHLGAPNIICEMVYKSTNRYRGARVRSGDLAPPPILARSDSHRDRALVHRARWGFESLPRVQTARENEVRGERRRRFPKSRDQSYVAAGSLGRRATSRSRWGEGAPVDPRGPERGRRIRPAVDAPYSFAHRALPRRHKPKHARAYPRRRADVPRDRDPWYEYRPEFRFDRLLAAGEKSINCPPKTDTDEISGPSDTSDDTRGVIQMGTAATPSGSARRKPKPYPRIVAKIRRRLRHALTPRRPLGNDGGPW